MAESSSLDDRCNAESSKPTQRADSAVAVVRCSAGRGSDLAETQLGKLLKEITSFPFEFSEPKPSPANRPVQARNVHFSYQRQPPQTSMVRAVY